ncbi:hypothetical protein Ccrd_026836 [Cynara cardunculus var. scolymus]|uniref:Uncharacterized protein n=1 Tax=Cynara cardunculus var. scolymus TaxID=59895 RepID=A0A118FDG9_CYNCS|nr:hypothetical protein Ccrd_026836 [Cynara cardunculus var. scolymus]
MQNGCMSQGLWLTALFRYPLLCPAMKRNEEKLR